MNRYLKLTGLLVALGIFSASSVFAIGSNEKTPEEQASDKSRKATDKYNNAVKRIEHARQIGLKGDSAYAYNYRATSDAKIRKELEKAVEDLTNAITINPDMKEAHNNLGYCYRKLGKLSESLAAYSKAIALDSNFAQAREYRAETYLAMGDMVKAEGELAYLRGMKSPFADQLALAIELYELAEIDKTAKETTK
jgi:tetratricopeptide (TPR) repeat protein